MKQWFSPQDLAAMKLAGWPASDRGWRKWAKKNLPAIRNKVRGKGAEIAFSSLPPALQVAIRAATSPGELASIPPEAGGCPGQEARNAAAIVIEEARKEAASIPPASPRALSSPSVAGKVQIVAEAALPPHGWGKGLRAWKEHVALKHGISPQTLYRWLKDEKEKGLDGLLHGNAVPRGHRAWDRQAVEYWHGLVLKREHRQMSQRVLYGHLADEAARQGWRIGSYSGAVTLAKEIPAPLLAYRDGGTRALDNALPSIRRDYGDLAPFEIIVGDQHRFDLWVRDVATGEIFRPEGYLWQDLCTRTVYGLAVGRRYDSRMIGQALWLGIRVYGRFGSVYTDNGRPELSKYLGGLGDAYKALRFGAKSAGDMSRDGFDEGILGDLGAGRRTARVRNAKAKMIESTFCKVEEVLRSDFALPGQVRVLGGEKERNDLTQDELAGLAASGKLLTFPEFAKALFEALDHYNIHRHHRGLAGQWRREATHTGGATAVPAPATPRAYLLDRIARGWRPEYIPERTLDLVFLARACRTVQRGRIQLAGEYYEADELVDLADGTRVDIRYDSMDPERPVIVLRGGEYLCDAAPMTWGSMVDGDMTRAKIARKRELHRAFREAYLAHTKPIPDLRRYSEAPPALAALDAAAGKREILRGRKALEEHERLRVRSQEEMDRERAEIEAREAEMQREIRIARRPKLPDEKRRFFEDGFDRYMWLMRTWILAGGDLDEDDWTFIEKYEAEELSQGALDYWNTYKGSEIAPAWEDLGKTSPFIRRAREKAAAEAGEAAPEGAGAAAKPEGGHS